MNLIFDARGFVSEYCLNLEPHKLVLKSRATQIGRKNIVSNSRLNMVVHDRERHISGLLLRVHNKNLIFLFLNQNICCGYSKEPSQ